MFCDWWLLHNGPKKETSLGRDQGGIKEKAALLLTIYTIYNNKGGSATQKTERLQQISNLGLVFSFFSVFFFSFFRSNWNLQFQLCRLKEHFKAGYVANVYYRCHGNVCMSADAKWWSLESVMVHFIILKHSSILYFAVLCAFQRS